MSLFYSFVENFWDSRYCFPDLFVKISRTEMGETFVYPNIRYSRSLFLMGTKSSPRWVSSRILRKISTLREDRDRTPSWKMLKISTLLRFVFRIENCQDSRKLNLIPISITFAIRKDDSFTVSPMIFKFHRNLALALRSGSLKIWETLIRANFRRTKGQEKSYFGSVMYHCTNTGSLTIKNNIP